MTFTTSARKEAAASCWYFTCTDHSSQQQSFALFCVSHTRL
jgi:hypothetical protein